MPENQSKRIGYFLERTSRIVKLRFLKEMSALSVDLTTEQWVVLDHLFEKNGQSQSELANACYKNAPTISRIIDILGSKGFIERQRFENDRRRYKIYLTDRGRSTVLLCRPVVDQLRSIGWENLNDADYDNFLRIVNQIFDNFQKR